jgi:Transposase IS66 family
LKEIRGIDAVRYAEEEGILFNVDQPYPLNAESKLKGQAPTIHDIQDTFYEKLGHDYDPIDLHSGGESFNLLIERDGFSSYKWYEQCRHSLCNVHLLRDLFFIEEANPKQKVWTAPLTKLLLKIKEAVAEAKQVAEGRLSEEIKNAFLRRYDKLVEKADRLNPPQPKRTVEGDSPKQKPVQQPTPRSLINRLQRRRDEVCAS